MAFCLHSGSLVGQARADDEPAGRGSDPTIDETMDAAGTDGDLPKTNLKEWNEFDSDLFSLRIGGGYLYDTAGYAQDEASEDQLDLVPTADLRDARVILKGKLKFIEGLSYTVGYMYDKSKADWFFRQTGLMLDIPALYGDLFVGRTKEGFSTSKIMVGYQGWVNERSAANDAFIPILADGIKWSGYIPDGTFVYNIGYFSDQLSRYETFNKNDMAVAVRGVWLPLANKSDGVLHLAFETRYSDANDGFLQYRSKPEVFEAQSYAIDTGKFEAQHSTMFGVETYYRPGSWMFGMEYYFNQVASRQNDNPFFHGGEIFTSYILTGEVKPYNARGAYFERLVPDQSVFEGGIGAWELVLRFSYADLDDGPIQGGKFWRVTPMVNWYVSENVRLEFVTGYGMLDRFDLEGGTVFVQTRLQLQL